MDQRGKKSVAALASVPVTFERMLPPPADLTAAQAALWASVVATKPSDWFQADSLPLLTQYCRAVDGHRIVSAEVDAFNPEWLKTDEGLRRYERLLAMQDRQAKLTSSLATKMRLTQQSRYAARGADRADARAKGDRPWSLVMEHETSSGLSPTAASRKART